MICNVVKHNQVKNETDVYRLDAEFYSSELMEYENKIKKKGYNKLGDLIDVLTDYTANGSFANLAQYVNVTDNHDYAKWVRIQNLDSNDFNVDIRYVDEMSYNFLKKTQLIGNELLISKTGEYLGKCYIFKPENKEKYTLADNIFLVKLKDKSLYTYIYAYINSEIGRKLLLRYSQGTGQPTIIKNNLRQLKIPKASKEIINEIGNLITKRYELLNESRKNYNIAQKIINNEIFPKDFVFSNNNSSIRKLSKIKSSDNSRLDSEYYQLKYYELEKILKGKCKTLAELVDFKDSIDPGSDFYVEEKSEDAIPFIRISNLSHKKINNNYLYVDKTRIKELDRYLLKKDEILLSKDGSIGISYLLRNDKEAIACGGILRLKVKDEEEINKEYLTAILNSSIVKMQARRDCGGSILKHWKKNQIHGTKIPVLPKRIQEQVAKASKLSFEQYNESESLLKIAVDSMEFIVNGQEKKALEYIKNNI